MKSRNIKETEIIKSILLYGGSAQVGDSFYGLLAIETEDANPEELEYTDIEVINISEEYMLIQALGEEKLILAYGNAATFKNHLYIEKIICEYDFGAKITDELIESEISKQKSNSKLQRKLEIIQKLFASSIYDESMDPLYDAAVAFVSLSNTASASSLQRKFRIGYNRALNLIYKMEEKGIVSPAVGTKPRVVLVNRKAR